MSTATIEKKTSKHADILARHRARKESKHASALERHRARKALQATVPEQATPEDRKVRSLDKARESRRRREASKAPKISDRLRDEITPDNAVEVALAALAVMGENYRRDDIAATGETAAALATRVGAMDRKFVGWVQRKSGLDRCETTGVSEVEPVDGCGCEYCEYAGYPRLQLKMTGRGKSVFLKVVDLYAR